jgi:hypothetical protein
LLALLALTLAGCATTSGGEDRRLGWVCTAEATSGPVRASSLRVLDFQGFARNEQTEFAMSLPGNPPANVFASWDRATLPEIAEGRYRFRMSRQPVPGEPARLQLVVGNQMVAQSALVPGLAEVAVNGRDIGPQLLSGAAMGLRLVTRDGRSLGSTGIDRASFDLAIELARQANANVLARASDFRNQCRREERITVT